MSNLVRLHMINRTFIEYLTPIFSGVSVPHMSGGQIENFKIPVPNDLLEIQKIVRFCNEVEARDIQVKSNMETQIEKLKEYKSTLINAAVTGQLEV